MKVQANSVEEYLENIQEERKEIISQIRDVINANIPEGFSECLNYGMIGWVVPHSKYPSGYHCDTKLPLPFINLASQKAHISLYHMGVYANPELMSWFQEEYPKHSKLKLNMGKSCIRFKKPEHVPIELIGQLVSKMSVEDWISLYEKNIKKS